MVAAAILAGGQGRRLGRGCKPLLDLGNGQRIVDRQLAVLRPLFDAVVIVAADRAPFLDLLCGRDGRGGAVAVITDRHGPGLGPLAGLDAALAWLPPSFQSIVCVAGDMPALTPAILAALRDAPAAAVAVVPRTGAGPEPLCARYDRALAAGVAASLAAGARAMHAFIDGVARAATGSGDGGGGGRCVHWLDEPVLRRLDPTLATFANINTAADLTAHTPLDATSV